MLEDAFPAAEKILSEIENVLKKDSNLLSFEIIPAEDNENRSPVRHEQHALGLASWCVKPLFTYAYNQLLELRRQNRQKREEPSTVSRWLQGALLLNPEIYTFWNMRRDLVKSERLEPMPEFRFVNLVIYHKPKCFEAFAYRRWLVKLILSRGDCAVDVPTLLLGEIKAAAVAAERYPNNCHAWSHREHVISVFEEAASSHLYRVLSTEWEESFKWCDRHVSDSSGFAYRQFLLKKLLLFDDQREIDADFLLRRSKIFLNFMLISGEEGSTFRKGNCRDVITAVHGTSKTCIPVQDQVYAGLIANLSYWMEECLLNKEHINVYPGHEALWYHRRYLAWSLTALTASYKRFSRYQAECFDPRNGISRPRSDDCLTRLEIAFREHNREIISSAKKLGQHQAVLAERFVKFLKSVNLEL